MSPDSLFLLAEDTSIDPQSAAFVTALFVLLLATFIGLEVIKNVSRLLHTPLMSLTNAISAIAVVGSIVLAGRRETSFSTILGSIALAASMTNIVSGFLITDRMLKMFKSTDRNRPKPDDVSRLGIGVVGDSTKREPGK
jgi:NAD(P) transhydrogenase subunit alpha